MNTLYKEYDFKNNYELINYVVESYINGQKKQVKELINEIISKTDSDTIKVCLVHAYEIFGINTLKAFLLPYLSESNVNHVFFQPTFIVNAFYDFDYSNFEKVKKQVQELTQEHDI